MSKSNKYFLFFLILAGLILAFSIKSDGRYFIHFAELIKQKAEPVKEDKRMHTLDLQEYRPKPPNQ